MRTLDVDTGAFTATEIAAQPRLILGAVIPPETDTTLLNALDALMFARIGLQDLPESVRGFFYYGEHTAQVARDRDVAELRRELERHKSHADALYRRLYDKYEPPKHGRTHGEILRARGQHEQADAFDAWASSINFDRVRKIGDRLE